MMNKVLRIAGYVVPMAGTAGSLFYIFESSRNQKSIVLISLFVLWVSSPFIGLAVINFASRTWPVIKQSILAGLIILISVVSIVFYSRLILLPNVRPAFVFLVVPFASWVIIAVDVLIIRTIKLSKK